MNITVNEIFYVFCGAAVLIMAVYYLKRKRKITSALFGAITGAAALILVNRVGGAIGTDIPLNAFNITGSCVLGVPFVICLVILENL